jgi:PKD repeat protein
MKTRIFPVILLVLLLGAAGCYKNEPVPAADFTFSGSNEFKVPCNVIFTNGSTNSFSWEWRFGDDSVSTLKDPSHTYHKPGVYSVYLRAYTESRNEWASVIRVIIIKDTLR